MNFPISLRSQAEGEKYETVPCGDAYLKISKSQVVGFWGSDTGLGLFTLKPIPKNTYICAYAPTASMQAASNQEGDYVIDVSLGEKVVSVNGAQNPYEIGLGIYINDGSFPFFLVPSKFSRLVASRVNCEYSKRGDEVWIKSKRAICAKEELLISYSANGSYWRTIFTADQLSIVKDALSRCGSTLEEANECIRNIDIEI